MRFFTRRRVGIAAFLVVPLVLGAWAWRAASWRPKVVLNTSEPILALAWASDGQTIHCASQDGQYRLLSGATLEVLVTSTKRGKWGKAQFSENGSLLLVADLGAEEAALIETLSERKLWELSFKSGNQESAKYPDGGRVLIREVGLSSRGKCVAICKLYAGAFDISTDVEIFEPKNGRKRAGQPLFSSEEYKSFSFMYDGAIRSALSFAPDENRIAVWKNRGVLALMDARTFKPLWAHKGIIKPPSRTLPIVFADDLTESSFAPDGQIVAVQMAKGAVYLFKARDGVCLRRFYLSGVSVFSLAFSPDSQLLAVGDSRGFVNLFEIGTGHLRKRITTRVPVVSSLAFSPDGSRLAVGASTGQVQLWRVR